MTQIPHALASEVETGSAAFEKNDQPVFVDPQKAIDITDITDKTQASVSNDDFLAAIFGSDFKDFRPLVCSKAGDPTGGGYSPQPWPSDTADPELNWYAQPSLYAPDVQGRYRAKAQYASKVYCTMLDDVGSKVSLDRLNDCPPTWLIETSPGNFQAGFVFSTPIEKRDADQLKAALIQGGLCDVGATGGSARWMRLPVAINGKKKHGDPPFRCRLDQWNPQLRYALEDLYRLLDLETPQAKKTANRAAAINRNAVRDVYTPRPDENAVVTALKLRGLYKMPLGDGKHDVTCPWVHEHTDQVDNGSCYFEPNDLYKVGGYKCQHSHGSQYRIGELITFLGVSFQEAKHKPTIRIEPGEMPRIADAAEQELANSGRYYQRGGLICSVVTDPSTAETTIRPLSQSALLKAMSSNAVWTRFDQRSGTDVVADPPTRHVAVLFDSEKYEHLPPLAGIARQPHLRPDGSLVRRAGYDAGTRLFGVFDERQFNIPDKPSKEDAVAALAEIQSLLSEFRFVAEHDLSAAISGILTAAIRQSLPAAPMYHFKAPQIASGKSYLQSITSAFAGPGAVSAVAFPSNEEECQKLLLATLLSAPAVIAFDNLTSDIFPHKSLCSALTEEHLTGRILGVSKTATVNTRSLILSSGNNVDAVKDMTRRCITVSLDPKVETPAARQFNADPLGLVKANRAKYVSLALTIVRAWIVSEEVPAKCKPLASYSQWSDWVRQPLMWLGLPDPAERIFERMAEDPEREKLGRLLQQWSLHFKSSPTRVRDAISTADDFGNADLKEILMEVAEQRQEINGRRLGRFLARSESRIVNGMRFERAGGTSSVDRWMVRLVATDSLTEPDQASQLVMSVKSVGFSQPAQSVSDENFCEVTL